MGAQAVLIPEHRGQNPPAILLTSQRNRAVSERGYKICWGFPPWSNKIAQPLYPSFKVLFKNPPYLKRGEGNPEQRHRCGPVQEVKVGGAKAGRPCDAWKNQGAVAFLYVAPQVLPIIAGQRRHLMLPDLSIFQEKCPKAILSCSYSWQFHPMFKKH